MERRHERDLERSVWMRRVTSDAGLCQLMVDEEGWEWDDSKKDVCIESYSEPSMDSFPNGEKRVNTLHNKACQIKSFFFLPCSHLLSRSSLASRTDSTTCFLFDACQEFFSKFVSSNSSIISNPVRNRFFSNSLSLKKSTDSCFDTAMKYEPINTKVLFCQIAFFLWSVSEGRKRERMILRWFWLWFLSCKQESEALSEGSLLLYLCLSKDRPQQSGCHDCRRCNDWRSSEFCHSLCLCGVGWMTI